jgi:peptide/nickel transport system ATP-binding protein
VTLALLDVVDLEVHYRTDRGVARAVDRASFTVPERSIGGLVGESGCGKTTAVRAIMRVMPGNAAIAGGRIEFAGRDLVRLSEAELARLRWREISFIPQTAMNSLDPVYRVGDQLLEVLKDRGRLGSRAARRRAEELFGMVGLDIQRLRDYPHQFSGGMRQRAAIAMALALEPALVLADEPVTALDVVVQRQVLDTIKALQARLGLAMVLVTHDISVVAYVCDYVVVMYAGKAVESGPAGEVLEHAAHPYTMGLTNAFPDLNSSRSELVPIEGSPPDLVDPPTGCRFKDRCPFRIPACDNPPPLVEVGPGHRAACWRAEEAASLRPLAAMTATWVRAAGLESEAA